MKAHGQIIKCYTKKIKNKKTQHAC
jgi:hypothetical protein